MPNMMNPTISAMKIYLVVSAIILARLKRVYAVEARLLTEIQSGTVRAHSTTNTPRAWVPEDGSDSRGNQKNPAGQPCRSHSERHSANWIRSKRSKNTVTATLVATLNTKVPSQTNNRMECAIVVSSNNMLSLLRVARSGGGFSWIVSVMNRSEDSKREA